MGKLVVTEFITLDGIIEDPGGSEGTEHGGWSFRHHELPWRGGRHRLAGDRPVGGFGQPRRTGSEPHLLVHLGHWFSLPHS